MSYCINCGGEIPDGAKFCSLCGKPVEAANESAHTASADHEQIAKKVLNNVTSKINALSGGEGSSIAKLSDLFNNVLKKHSRKESEQIFICGTETTTPELESLESDYPKPWLYSRVLAVFAITFMLLNICAKELENMNAVPGVIFMGSFMIPITLAVMFFEMNMSKNISFFNVIKMFLIGGGASLLLTLILFEIVTVDKLDYMGAILVGVIEELGKLGIIYFFLKEANNSKYYVNALLVGATVGAGFAAFESAGYALRYYLMLGYDGMIDVIILRAVLAPGGHIVWAAITGFAILSAKGKDKLTYNIFKSSRFWKLFWIPVTLHSIWDMPIKFGSDFHLIPIFLTILSWIVILVLIDQAYKQVSRLCAAAKAAKNAEADYAVQSL